MTQWTLCFGAARWPTRWRAMIRLLWIPQGFAWLGKLRKHA
ncbi:hypothetical protein STSO111631_19495 [Stackebrandtia soli]